MIAELFKALRPAPGLTPAAPAPVRAVADVGPLAVYAIGDVHGRSDLLEALLLEIDRRERGRALLVGLGDYLDRGADSRGVIESMLAAEARMGVRPVWLRGNHEQIALEFLNDAEAWARWRRIGGEATMGSYGLSVTKLEEAGGHEAVRSGFGAVLPAKHLALLRETQLHLTVGGYVFVHAGLASGVPLAQQTADDLLWSVQGPVDVADARIVVHGHVPRRTPRLESRAIAVDTGAYATGVLTAVRLHRREVSFVQAKATAGATPRISEYAP